MMPGIIVVAAFFLIPLALVVMRVADGPDGWATYFVILTNGWYFASLVQTLLMSAGVTLTALILCSICGLFLVRNQFAGRSMLTALLTLPLSFPGTVVGFMVIMLAGRQGVIGSVSDAIFGEKLVFAYEISGLFIGYLYFSIPRVILAVMASAEKLDPQLEEAARSLGAPTWRVVKDVILPGLMPGLISSGAICFATAMGAFGTAFTLATDIDVLPMVIYTEFTRNANVAVAAALSIALGAMTWVVLFVVRCFVGNSTDVAPRGGA
ncbi:ABC transporter permease [Thalassospira lucentensis]|uniref:ABC transporter permease n=1 Tax=Thalassospira lucentensis TaxID=168935 RepID=UPI000524C19C|nr:ABC transporter permease [Thalassospira lucentensis]RCK21979.1 ABC transporter permease [Thalassospira lucentensis MCCC 1A00383 = DSM 14000]